MQTTTSPRAETEADKLPRHTTPTWEVELLISGVAVFAMLKLPGWLDHMARLVLPSFALQWSMPMEMAYVYLKAAALLLAATFALHLLLRAQWIARVGLHSVFPEGIRWDNTRMGPVQRAAEQGLLVDAATRIERADNRATVVFAIGVSLASMLLMIACIFALLVCVVSLLLALFGVHLFAGWVSIICAVAFAGPIGVFNVCDRLFGSHLRTGGRLRRWLAAGHRFYARAGFGNASSALALVASYSKRRALVLIYIFVWIVVAAAIVGTFGRRGGFPVGTWSLFPHFGVDHAKRIDPAHYADQSGGRNGAVTPYVQSIVVGGPYLRLVVPYAPRDAATTLRQDCHEASSSRHSTGHTSALLACLSRMHAVTLDGKPQTVDFLTGRDASGRPALLAMIDVRSLARGRHVLRVARIAAPEPLRNKQAPVADAITFWR